MEEILIEVTYRSIKIIFLVFLMMVVVDVIEVLTKGKLKNLIKRGQNRQYLLSSSLGATPGCFGSFINVSLYVHGLITFGALTGGMIATSGDEAFIMLTLFPKQALLLFLILFFLGVILGWTTDKFVKTMKIQTCEECALQEYHPHQLAFKHYLREHIWLHIIKKHIWKVFLWTFFTLSLIEIGLKYLNLDSIVKENQLLVLLISGMIGILPQSGPHLLFVVLFSNGLIPFSILLTSSIVQDGHGMLPLLSFTLKDSIKVKFFNFFFGILIGFILLSIGV
ncbi:MAG: putative manganese transporter [Candidatus Aminicenantia bacterium]